MTDGLEKLRFTLEQSKYIYIYGVCHSLNVWHKKFRNRKLIPERSSYKTFFWAVHKISVQQNCSRTAQKRFCFYVDKTYCFKKTVLQL